MNIVVLGGGVAGISSAIALKQKGFDVAVYERHKSEKNIGAGIGAFQSVLLKIMQISKIPLPSLQS